MGCGSSSASPPVATPNDANATQKYSQQNAQQNANASKQPAATAASKAQAPAPAESKAPAQPQAQVQTQANQQSGQPAANQQSAQQPAQQPKEQPQQALQPPQLQTLSVGVQLSSSPSLGKSPTITRSPTEMKSLSRYLVLVVPRREFSEMIQFGLQVSILQGRNIKKKDLMGDSDAYVKVSLSPSADASPPKETKTVNNTQKPVWNQQFRFEQLTTAGPRPEELIIGKTSKFRSLVQLCCFHGRLLQSQHFAIGRPDWLVQAGARSSLPCSAFLALAGSDDGEQWADGDHRSAACLRKTTKRLAIELQDKFKFKSTLTS